MRTGRQRKTNNGAAVVAALTLAACTWATALGDANPATPPVGKSAAKKARIIFLHHSTGECVWNGGVPAWFAAYNASNKTDYRITERAFPAGSPYGWRNYPYDYWNIWVKHAGPKPYKNEPTLEMLTRKYDVIVFKHCFPVANIQPDTGDAQLGSPEKRIENYKLQYNSLKEKMRKFPKTRFIVWTGAVHVKANMDESAARRAREFFNWVKTRWDQKGDNIFIWDFYQLQTEGGLYLKPEFAQSPSDSHPNEAFSKAVAPKLCRRIVSVIAGRGDSTDLTGKAGKALPASVPAVRQAATKPAPQRPSPASAPAKPRAAVDADPDKWVFDDAEGAELFAKRWEEGAQYVADGSGHVVKIDFAEGEAQDWGEYGPHRVVFTKAPSASVDIAGYRYLALRIRSDKQMTVVMGLITLSDPAAGTARPYFAFNGYLRPKAGPWQWVVLDLTRLELEVEGPSFYEKVQKPSRPLSLSMLKFCAHQKNADAAFAVDDLTFLRSLPKPLLPYLSQD